MAIESRDAERRLGSVWENVDMYHDLVFTLHFCLYYLLSIRCSAQVHSADGKVAGSASILATSRGLEDAGEAFLDTGKLIEDPAYDPSAHR